MSDDFGEALTRVIKKVQRNGKPVKQAFHVRQAAPGDEYSALKTSALKTSPQKNPKATPRPASQDPQAVQDPAAQDIPPEEMQQPPVTRMTVSYFEPPWKKDEEEEQDPIPRALRKRFDKDNKAANFINPQVTGMPVISVVPTDRIFWGGDEPDILRALRLGSIRRMRLVGDNGMMVVKLEAIGSGSYAVSAGSFYAYMWMESLRCPLLRQIWGDLIDFGENGTLSKRAAAAYETAKACGLDDLTPPTVYRQDTEGDVRAMLPDSLIERISTEWVSRQTGKDADTVRKEISGHATVQLIRGEPWPIEEEEWFSNLFKESDPDALNQIWSYLPPERRVAFLRLAALDFLVGSLDRSYGDMAFSDDPRHPVMVFGGEMSCPCPRKIGLAYIGGNYSGYADPLDPTSGGLPLLWSEASTMLATQGTDQEIADFEAIGISVADRMKDDRGSELARALLEYGLTPLQIAGILTRIWMMQTFSRDIARDPYFAARYYGSVVSGNPDSLMEGLADFANNVLSKVMVNPFDFYEEMKRDDAGDI